MVPGLPATIFRAFLSQFSSFYRKPLQGCAPKPFSNHLFQGTRNPSLTIFRIYFLEGPPTIFLVVLLGAASRGQCQRNWVVLVEDRRVYLVAFSLSASRSSMPGSQRASRPPRLQ